jgi:hypothetical protein
MHLFVRALAQAVLVFAAVGCGFVPEPSLTPAERVIRDLTAAEQRWASLGIDSYRFTMAYHCFCPFREPIEVSVERGSVTSIRTVDGRAAPLDEVNWWPTTIPAALRTVRDNLDAHEIDASFDSATGVPTNVRVDVDFNTADEEFSFEITQFEVIEPSG